MLSAERPSSLTQYSANFRATGWHPALVHQQAPLSDCLPGPECPYLLCHSRRPLPHCALAPRWQSPLQRHWPLWGATEWGRVHPGAEKRAALARRPVWDPAQVSLHALLTSSNPSPPSSYLLAKSILGTGKPEEPQKNVGLGFREKKEQAWCCWQAFVLPSQDNRGSLRAFPSELNSPESSILLHPGFVPPIIWYMKNMTEEKWIKIGKAVLSIVKGICCCFSHIWLFVMPWTIACQAPLSMRFSRQECWNELPFPPPGDLPNPGIKPWSLMSPALAGGFFTTIATWKVPWKEFVIFHLHT